jgi:hypothetical protein
MLNMEQSFLGYYFPSHMDDLIKKIFRKEMRQKQLSLKFDYEYKALIPKFNLMDSIVKYYTLIKQKPQINYQDAQFFIDYLPIRNDKRFIDCSYVNIEMFGDYDYNEIIRLRKLGNPNDEQINLMKIVTNNKRKRRIKRKRTPTKPKQVQPLALVGNVERLVPKTKSVKTKTKQPQHNMHINELKYLKSLADPFNHRGVRLPSTYPIATQVITFHGNITFSANANGFARLFMFCCGIAPGEIWLYNDATHNDVTLGPGVVTYSPTFSVERLRVVNGGLKCRSMTAITNESGYVQAYSSNLVPTNPAYDVYRDNPHQHIYQKGEVAHVRYIPAGIQAFDFVVPKASLSVTAYESILPHTIGFMVVGAPNQNFMLQYSVTFEILSGTNTDLNPSLINSGGTHTNVLPLLNNANAAKVESWFSNLPGKTASFLSSALGYGVNKVIEYGTNTLAGISSGPQTTALAIMG